MAATDITGKDLVLVDPPLSTPPVNVKDVFDGSFPVLPRNPKSRPHLAGE